MKTVFRNDMVAHVWAQQTQSEGRSSTGNFSFRDTVLYSYSTPIAAFVKGTRKRIGCLISNRSFSNTTNGKHLPQARRAASGAVFSVSNVRPHSKTDHKANLAELVANYAKLCKTFRNMRQSYHTPESIREYLISDAHKAIAYAELFGLRKPKLQPEADAAAIWEFRAARDARMATPEYQAKAERAKLARERSIERKAEEKRQADYSRMQQRFVIHMMEEDHYTRVHAYDFPHDTPEFRYLDAVETAEKRRDAEALRARYDAWIAGTSERPDSLYVNGELPFTPEQIKVWTDARNAEEIAKHAKQIADWRDGGTHTYFSSNVPVMLRLKTLNTGEPFVQTSQGAEFPLSHALAAIPYIYRCKAANQGWTAQGQNMPLSLASIQLGSFAINAIEANGNVRAGCHYVTFEEIDRFVVVLRAIGIEVETA